MTIAESLDRDTNRSNRPAYIETIQINNAGTGMIGENIENWVSLAFDGLNGTLTAGEGTHNPLPPLYITSYGARQLAGALYRLAERVEAEGWRLG